MRWSEFFASVRLDLADVRRSRWLILCLGLYAAMGTVFVLVGLRESTLLGFTGMGRVLLSVTHALVILLPLLALGATGQVVNRARDEGELELLFTMPLHRSTYFAAVCLTRYLVLLLPLVAVLGALGAIGRLWFGQSVPWFFLGRSIAVSASLLFTFTCIGLALSSLVRHQARALMWLLLTWATAVAFLDFGIIGLMLRWRLNPRLVFLLAGANPLQAARMALLSGLDGDLGTLGPVGFFLATRVGAPALFAFGTLWPVVAGLLALLIGLWHFCRADLT